MSKPFEIELLEQHWLGGDPTSADKCSHGRLRVSIGGHEVSDASEDNYGISTSALALLRTLESNHTCEDPRAHRLVQHGCGAILMMTCPVGIDWSVRHDSGFADLFNAVTYPSVNEADAIRHLEAVARLPVSEYRDVVVRLADAVEAFFQSQPPRAFDNSFDQQDYDQFWAEFRSILKRQCDR